MGHCLTNIKPSKGMKFYFSLPKNEEFFNSYATLTPTLVRLGYFAQIISALTEVGVIYALLYGSLQDFIPGQAAWVSMLGAFAGTGFLEIGLRKFVPYAFRAVLYRRFSGLHLVMSISIFFVCLSLLAVSGYLSFKGSREVVEAIAPKPKLETFTEGESYFQSEVQGIESLYSGQITALQSKYSSLVQVEKLKLESWQEKEAKTGLNYSSRKAGIIGKIAALEAQAANELAELEAIKAKQLAEAQQRRSQGRARIEKGNEEAVSSAKAKHNKYGFGLGYFTIFCLAIFVFSAGLNEVHHKGAGIEEKPLPTQYHFSQPVLSELLQMLSEKANFYIRHFVRKMEERTPEPVAPGRPPVLYEYSPQIERRQIGFQVPPKTESNATDITHTQGASCQHCGKSYQAKVSWQKFCSPECKEAFHAAKHGGTPFNPSKYSKGRK